MILDGNGNDVSTNYAHIANVNPIRYRGYYYDIESGFYYLNSRYYDPEIGRFINADAKIFDYINTYRPSHKIDIYISGISSELRITNKLPQIASVYFISSKTTEISTQTNSSWKPKLIDITDKLTHLMRTNTVKFLYEISYYEEVYGDSASIAVLFEFCERSKTGGMWDLKNQDEWKLDESSNEFFVFNGKRLRSQDVGNIHFGYVGSSIFGVDFLNWGAGMYQIYSGTSDWLYILTCFDDPIDYEMIRYGNELYRKDVGLP